MFQSRAPALGSALALLLSVCPTLLGQQAVPDRPRPNGGAITVTETDEGAILATDLLGTQVFQDLADSLRSDVFTEHGVRCGAVSPEGQLPAWSATSDWSNSNTNPSNRYAPSGGTLYRIPVVVHVLYANNGSGNRSDATIQSQIDILNEDSQALPGSNGAPGSETSLEVFAADTDPDGNLSSSLNWSSNLDGSLGSGSSFSSTLSVGTHTVTAPVSDSGGKSGSDAISVTVTSLGGGGISSSISAYHVKGRVHVDLPWSGAVGGTVEIDRDGSLLTNTANDGFDTDNTGLKGSGSLTSQLCEPAGGRSNQSVANDGGTTADPSRRVG